MDAHELTQLAFDAGWAVTGHRWLRMTKADTSIDVWFAGANPRIVSADRTSASGTSAHLDIVHNRATSLPETVRSWLTTPQHAVDLVRVTTRAPRHTGGNGRLARKVALFA